MKKILLLIPIGIATCCYGQQPVQRNEQMQKIDTTHLDLKVFAKQITGNESDDFEKAKKILARCCKCW